MKFHENKRNLEFKVGIFTLLAIVILVLGYAWFTYLLEHHKTTLVKVQFANVGKIEKGSDVSVRGIKQGKVSDLELTQSGVILHLQVALERPLPQDSKFYIKEMDIMGNVRVDIEPGTSEQKMDYSKIQKGEKIYGISNLVVKLNHLAAEMQTFMNKFQENKNLFPQIKRIVNSSEKFINDLQQTFSSNKTEITNSINNLSTLIEEMNSFLKENKTKLSSGIAKTDTTLTNLNNAIVKFDQLSTNLNSLVQETKTGQGSLGKIVAEEELYNNILEATVTLDSLLKDIKDNPGRYFKIKVF